MTSRSATILQRRLKPDICLPVSHAGAGRLRPSMRLLHRSRHGITNRLRATRTTCGVRDTSRQPARQSQPARDCVPCRNSRAEDGRCLRNPCAMPLLSAAFYTAPDTKIASLDRSCSDDKINDHKSCPVSTHSTEFGTTIEIAL